MFEWLLPELGSGLSDAGLSSLFGDSSLWGNLLGSGNTNTGLGSLFGGGSSSGGGSFWDSMGSVLGGVNFGNLLGDAATLGTSLLTSNDKSYTNGLQDLAGSVYKMGDPFAGQREYYQNLLSNSYSDPEAIYNDQYSKMDKTFYGDMMANASKEGRTTDAYAQGLAREGQFQQYLGNYRNQLAQLAGGNVNPGQAANAYGNMVGGALGINNQNSMAPYYALGNMLNGGQQSSSGGLGNLLGTGANLVGSAAGSLGDVFSGIGDSIGGLFDW